MIIVMGSNGLGWILACRERYIEQLIVSEEHPFGFVLNKFFFQDFVRVSVQTLQPFFFAPSSFCQHFVVFDVQPCCHLYADKTHHQPTHINLKRTANAAALLIQAHPSKLSMNTNSTRINPYMARAHGFDNVLLSN